MPKTRANKPLHPQSTKRRSLSNNLKAKLGMLVRIIDFNKDKSDILEAKLWKYKTDFYDWVATLDEHEVKYLSTNDYYHCIVSRIGE